jgi:hypothetical protein
MKQYLLLATLILIFSSCQSNQSSKPIVQTQVNSNSHVVIVKEVMQVAGYTYLRVTENEKELWLATPPITATVGETLYYEGGFEMTNFKSKELNRTFESIYFLEGISKEPIEARSKEDMVSPGATAAKEGKKEIAVTPAEGGISIAELYSKRATYEGKTVKIKAEVTKFSPEIMGTNWIHAQDGTDSEGNFDLTVTSDETVTVGDVVVFEGKVVLKKDLGYGYFFEVLLEDAKVVK